MREVTEIKIREANQLDLEEISKIHVDAWKFNYKGIIPDTFLNELSYNIQRKKWEKRLLTENKESEKMFVLEVDKEIKGFISGTILDEKNGSINTIYFSPQYQRKGYGTKLFNYMRKKMNCENIEVWCLEENKCRKFYDKLGGVVKKRTSVNIGGKIIEELQYIFREE